MRRQRAQYECQAFPDGTWTVRYIHMGECCETVGSGKVPDGDIGIGESRLAAAKRAAKELVYRRKAEAAERARLTDGAVTFMITA